MRENGLILPERPLTFQTFPPNVRAMPSAPVPDRLLLGLAAAAILVLVAAASFRRVWEADFFWQWRTGELVAQSGPPRVDTLSYVSAGRPWIEMRWLYCRLLYGVVSLAGIPGAVAAKWLAVLAAFLLATAAAPWRRAAAAACVVLPVAVLAASQRFFVRPELVSFVLFSAFVCILVRARQGAERLLYLLPPLQVLWANAHTLFLLGPAVVALYVAVEMLRFRREPRRLLRPLAVLAATAAACLLTPYGWTGVRFGLHLLTELRDPVYRRMAAEFVPTLRFGQRYFAVVFYEVLLGICALTAIGRWRRLDPFLSLLLLSQLALSLLSIRNLPLFCLAAVPFVVEHAPAQAAWPPSLRRVALAASIAFCSIASWALATDRFYVWQHDTNQFGAGIASHRFPVQATRFVQERLHPRRLFHPLFEGSYLAARGVPTFVDPRLEVHSRAHLARFVRMMDDRAAFQEAVADEGCDGALLDLQSPFLGYLTDDRDWSLVHFDDVAAVFARAGALPALTGPEIDATAARLHEALGGQDAAGGTGVFARVVSPVPYMRLAQFLVRVGRPGQAGPFAQSALAVDPRTLGAHEMLGRAAEAGDEPDRALEEYLRELASDPTNALAARQAGLLLFQTKREEEAMPLLAKAVARVPGDAQVWGVLTKIHADAHRTEAALDCARRAAMLAPGNVSYQANLGRLCGIAGRLEEGIAALRRAAALAPEQAGLHRDLALLLAQSGRRDEAREVLARALALSPDDANARELQKALAP